MFRIRLVAVAEAATAENLLFEDRTIQPARRFP
jgi:hypothetical protein